jgi:hypothetical protein
MSVTATNLILRGANTMPDDDVTQYIGGAIDTKKKVEQVDIVASGVTEGLSNTGGDARTLDVTYRDAAGVSATKLITLNGATAVSFGVTMERILKIVASSSLGGNITVRKLSGGTNLATLISGVKEVRRPFYNAVAPAAGTKSYYEKIFFRNSHGTLALTSASIYESADPTGLVTFALDGVASACPLNLGVNNGANVRTTPPSARITAFSNASKGVRANNNLQPGSAQGIWLRLLLSNTDTATKTSYTVGVKGNST